MKRIGPVVLSLAALAAPAAPALADEVWANGTTTVVWEAEDVDGYAVFSFAMRDAKTDRSGAIFVYGLRGAMADRDTFGGYWATDDPAAEPCPMAIVGADGEQYRTWGFVELTFAQPAFPAGWSAALGHCFEEAVEFWTVEPVTGGEPGPGNLPRK